MRAAIVQEVQEQPGIHFRELQRQTDCSVTTLNYHLSRSPSVEDVTIRGYRRIYPADIPADDYSPLAALNHASRGKILYTVDQTPDITGVRIAGRVDLAAATVSDHLHVLTTAELLEYVERGREKRYQVPDLVGSVIERYADIILRRTTANFIDMWG